MTTRDQASRRAAEARSDAAARNATTKDATRGSSSRAGTPSAALTSLPERLLAARERKGVDLFRAERDTKIRARYLAALERGDYRELPGAVYTKGFLRNYALYLGLDPDEILLQWRRERGDGSADPVPVVPRTVTAPRQGITISPRVFGGLLLVLVVVVVVGYVATQLVRFSKPPTITVTDPATAVVTVDDSVTTYTIARRDEPGGHGLGHDPGPRPADPGDRRRRTATGTSMSSCAGGATSSASPRPTPTPASKPTRRTPS